MMNIDELAAIDVHGHYGVCRGLMASCQHEFMSGDAATVAARARQNHIELTVVSPLSALHPRGRADAAAGNDEAAAIVPRTAGLALWAVVHPLQRRTYEQAAELLTRPWCVGIKIHPEEHTYPIREHGEAIFAFAERHGATILTHSGERNSLPEDFVPFADAHPGAKLILAHIGCGYDGDVFHQMRAVQRSRHGNIFADTSSSSNILPGVIERVVAEVGAQRVLFGTDTPLYHTGMQRARIDRADLEPSEKSLILRGNAQRLLPLDALLARPRPAPSTPISPGPRIRA